MKLNKDIITYTISSILFIILMMNSGLKFNSFLSPMSFISEIFSGTITDISWPLVIVSILMFCVSFAFFSIQVYNNKHDNSILIFSALISFIIVLLNVFSIPSIIFSLGFFIASFQVMTSVRKEKEKLKRPKISDILGGVSSKALTLLNISLALAVFIILVGNPSYAENELSSISQSVVGMDISDMESLQQQILDQQKEAAYAQIEAIETSVLYGIYGGTSDLTTSEKAKCFNAINNSMKEIDRQAKASIDMQMSTSGADQMGSIESTLKLLTLFKQFYPHITALTIFMLLGMFKLFLKDIIVVIASIFNTRSKPTKETPQSKPVPQKGQSTLNQNRYSSNSVVSSENSSQANQYDSEVSQDVDINSMQQRCSDNNQNPTD
ncbi:MAG: hypothetical protein GQ477_04930 [Nanohaloarchaea archaeon]|nr:hypothetical protein [Candidatus Nanohaloarchaea archaeon]